VERRECQRYFVDLPIEIRGPNTSFPLRGATADVSLGGCYVATIFPLAIGVKVEFTLQVAGEDMKGHGVIRTSHPGIGMGIQFIDLSEADLLRLDGYLSKSEITQADSVLRSFLR
jgi:hypothetical protein